MTFLLTKVIYFYYLAIFHSFYSHKVLVVLFLQNSFILVLGKVNIKVCVELYRWSIELEGIFVLPLAPRWVRHSYLSKKATNDPLYLWVIKTFFWRRCQGAIAGGEYSHVCLFALSLSRFILCSCFLSLVMGR